MRGRGRGGGGHVANIAPPTEYLSDDDFEMVGTAVEIEVQEEKVGDDTLVGANVANTWTIGAGVDDHETSKLAGLDGNRPPAIVPTEGGCSHRGPDHSLFPDFPFAEVDESFFLQRVERDPPGAGTRREVDVPTVM